MKREAKLNKQQYAYEVIRSRILNGTYGPGQRIVIDQIAKEVGSSSIPVREAIRQLEADGLIEYKPNSGAVVSTINEQEYLDTLSVLAVMEGYATRISAERIGDQVLNELEELNQQMQKALEEFDFEQFGRLNRAFHEVIYQQCPNQFLLDTIRRAWQRLDSVRRSGFTLVPHRAKHSIEEHAQLISLIRTKAPLEQIEAYAREHKLNTVRAFVNRKPNSSFAYLSSI
ncbi:transcriptional regulator, GntR family [Caldalkalibacillus thermarum TA2.A1]|uniref:GntR family transcriptional regulator n=1 Tax=Caldalkalibacillus thermarum (strain TA2.A1) TaxID=986075 RepID=F5L6B7_CALTT|nr:GntR family transcriptional regulator [Caldalkalibacillus thermarum]EGL83117.1 transcriptional regulator, GntR family [Caldalkalibacillus thermarum TA2.A1]QZT32469.1 GntR family transcriptional regulator [Caldalkalibacillus thermarum TA2.A1]